MEKLWTKKELAAYLGMSVSYIEKNYEKFPHLRIGRKIRFHPKSVDSYVYNKRVIKP